MPRTWSTRGSSWGCFTRLAKTTSGLTPGALAADLGLHEAYVRLWCEAACALELLDYDPSTGYRLALFMDQVLGTSSSTYYLGGFPEIHLLIARDYSRYPELFSTRGTQPYQEHDDRFLKGVADATHVVPRMFIDAVLPKLAGLQARLESGIRILDIGCGAGHAIAEFATRYPNTRCVGIDVEPTSIAMAQALIAERGLADRISAHHADGAALPAAFAGAFDLVTSFLVLHEVRPGLKDAVLEQCVRAMRPDGLLLLFDERYPGTPADLRDAAQVFAVMAQWYEMKWGNVLNTREEIHAMLARQGLRIVDETSLSRFYILTAQRHA
jgi:SAM-dependent methyltransferase